MKSLYLAQINVTVMFASGEDLRVNEGYLKAKACEYMRDEMRNTQYEEVEVKEINDAEEIPKEWVNWGIYGPKESLTPGEFLMQRAEKMGGIQEFEALKKKFAKVEQDPEFQRYQELKKALG